MSWATDRGVMAMAEVQTYNDYESLSRATAELIAACGAQAVADRGRYLLGLSGGRDPRRTYELLASAPIAETVDWSNTHIFWSDERHVPHDDPESNYRLAKETLLDHVPVPASQIHPFPTDVEPRRAARQYDHLLREFFGAPAESLRPLDDGTTFDFLLLGMGDDGHTASLFPESGLIFEDRCYAAAEYVPKLESWRLTLTPAAINGSRQIVVLASGRKKAERVRKVLEGPQLPEKMPIQNISPRAGRLVWMLDAESASDL